MDKKEKAWKSFSGYQGEGQFAEALETLKELTGLDPNNSLVYLRMGDIYQKTGDMKETVSSYFRAAEMLNEGGFGNKALAVYKMVLRVDPQNSVANEKLGFAVKEAEQIREAEVEARKAESKAVTEHKEVVIFECLSREELDVVYEKSGRMDFSAGSTVVNEGDHGDSLFVVESGELKVMIHFMGTDIEIGDLAQGDVFGEISFLTGKPRSASVIASTDVRVLEIKKDLLSALIEKHADINNILTGFYESRVQETKQKIKAGMK